MFVAGVTDTLPVVFPPVENPVPVHVVAFVDDHVRVEEPPRVTDVGDAENVATAAGTPVTGTVFVLVTVPPNPLIQVIEYVVSTTGLTETPVLLFAALPVENPVPVQEVAFADDQVRAPEDPYAMLAGPESVAVGADAAIMVTVSLPVTVEQEPPHV